MSKLWISFFYLGFHICIESSFLCFIFHYLLLGLLKDVRFFLWFSNRVPSASQDLLYGKVWLLCEQAQQCLELHCKGTATREASRIFHGHQVLPKRGLFPGFHPPCSTSILLAPNISWLRRECTKTFAFLILIQSKSPHLGALQA